MNNANHKSRLPTAALLEARQGQIALTMTAHLHRGAQVVPHDIAERLRVARERASAVAADHRRATAARAAAATAIQYNGSHTARLSGPPSFWLRLVSMLPLVLLVAGMVLIQHHNDTEQISAAAEIDSELLADELPPDAYRDPGFREFLRSETGGP